MVVVRPPRCGVLLTRRMVADDMRFDCFGGRCGVWGGDEAGARRQLESWHRRFSRFLPDSELSRLNRDPREVVPISAEMARLLGAIHDAAAATGGLVDGTLVAEIEAAGYATDLGTPVPLDVALALAPPRAARPAVALRCAWTSRLLHARLGCALRPPPARAHVRLGRTRQGTVRGPAGGARGRAVRRRLRRRPALRRTAPHARGRGPVRRARACTCSRSSRARRRRAGSASGPGWTRDGRPAHHLLDPATGRPAFTGVVQATALAPTAVEAEWRAKAALLSADATWLDTHGGLVVFDDGPHQAPQPRR